MTLTQRIRVGLRRETIIVFPVVVLLLATLSVFTLISYRRAVLELVAERQENARLAADRLVELFSGSELPAPEVLRALVPEAERLTLLDSRGFPAYSRGTEIGVDPLADLVLSTVESVEVAGPSGTEPFVSALTPVSFRGRRHYLRIDIEAANLARQLAALRPLTWVVIAANAGLTLLALLFVRHLLTPYDRLMARAREILPGGQEMEDEVALLVNSFERAVEALRRPESVVDELAALQQTLGPSFESGLVLVDEAEMVLAVNPAGLRILGIAAPTQPTPLDGVLAAHDDLYRVLSRAVADRRTVQRQEVTLANAEGERLLGLSVHPLRRNDGSIRAYLVLFADLTETRRQAEAERLATSLEQVGEMAAGVAHEMRNSLATFRGYLTLIDRAPHDAAIAEHLTELRRETDHLHRVLEDFLSFAKPGSMRLERTDLASLVERTLRDPLLERHAIAVRARPVLVDGDPALLERAVRNLLLNAIQATRGTPDPEPITVDVTSEDRYAVLRIADRGPGLPANLRGALFQPFVTGRADGVGLGLALAHRIVQLHGGRLDLSDRPDGGAQATVEVPLADAPDHRPDDQSR